MEADNVPAHHIRSEFCTTRPAYRQGRELKAVKVYTVVNESKYLLIHGVPAVGAGRDLIKLCALYGAVEEYRVLDDYPTDRFTEVYWVKFSRIQSARFAKRKLDNHSFFGGVLHICYAPEYETVEETREKLQERRKVIAMKTRQNAAATKSSLSPPAAEEPTPTAQPVSSEGIISGFEVNDNHAETNSEIIQHFHPAITQPVGEFSGRIQTPIEPAYFTLQIPPPPQVMYAGGLPSQHLPQQFQHARVPSSHATLPHGYDPRKHNSGLQELSPIDNVSSSSGMESNKGMSLSRNSPIKGSSQVIDLKNTPCIKPKQNELQKFEGGRASIPPDLVQTKGKDSSKVVVKSFKKSGAPPKFVPRQAAAAMKRQEQGRPTEVTDRLSQQIRRNAVTLQTDVQGPKLPDGRVHSKDPLPPEEVSVEKTVQEIRQKLSQFSEVPLAPMKKKLKPS